MGTDVGPGVPFSEPGQQGRGGGDHTNGPTQPGASS